MQRRSKISSNRVKSKAACGQAFDRELHVQRLEERRSWEEGVRQWPGKGAGERAGGGLEIVGRGSGTRTCRRHLSWLGFLLSPLIHYRGTGGF